MWNAENIFHPSCNKDKLWSVKPSVLAAEKNYYEYGSCAIKLPKTFVF